MLERLSGPLCDAVTGRRGSQALLEQVDRAGLFLVPLDEVRGWWRYHHLFADLLRARLQDQQPGQAAQLHRNAAAWCQEHGLADDAIRHAIAAGEMTWAAELVEQHFDAVLYMHGEGATTQRWISALPGELVRCRPRLLLAQSFLASYSGQLEAVEPLLDAAERASPGWADEPFEPTVGRARSLLVNVPALIALQRSYLGQLRGDAEVTVAFASRALAERLRRHWLITKSPLCVTNEMTEIFLLLRHADQQLLRLEVRELIHQRGHHLGKYPKKAGLPGYSDWEYSQIMQAARRHAAQIRDRIRAGDRLITLATADPAQISPDERDKAGWLAEMARTGIVPARYRGGGCHTATCPTTQHGSARPSICSWPSKILSRCWCWRWR